MSAPRIGVLALQGDVREHLTALDRLGVDHVDLYQLHDIEFSSRSEVDDGLAELVALRDEGLVRAVGVTGFHLPLLAELTAAGQLDAVLSYCRGHVLDRGILELVPVAEAAGTAVINASPLCMSLLTEDGPADRHPADEPMRAARDRFAEAEAVLEVGQREAEALGTGWSMPLWHCYRAELRLAVGRLDDAATEAEAGLRVAAELDALALTASMSLAACGSEEPADSAADDTTTSETPAEEETPMESEEPAAEPAAAGPFGPGCAAVPADGAGSFSGMAADPVATAASNNPVLSTLVTAVGEAGLGETLNTAKDITVFAPTNDAFAKIPKADLDKLLANKAELTKVLTAHVVGEKLTPMQLEKGSFDTLAKTKLTTAGSGEEYTVNDSSKVVCGNVPTANATVYVIDTVMMP